MSFSVVIISSFWLFFCFGFLSQGCIWKCIFWVYMGKALAAGFFLSSVRLHSSLLNSLLCGRKSAFWNVSLQTLCNFKKEHFVQSTIQTSLLPSFRCSRIGIDVQLPSVKSCMQARAPTQPLKMSPSYHFDIDSYLNRFIPRSRLHLLPKPISHFLGYRSSNSLEKGQVGSVLVWFWSFIGAICGILIVAAVFRVPLLTKDGAPVIIGSLVRSPRHPLPKSFILYSRG